jgi:predicted DNA-binding transcriptional regulator AlpA
MTNTHSGRVSLRTLSIHPRGLSRIAAANYVGISPSTFDQLVKDGRMPSPKRINARTIWDIWQLDEAFDALPSDGYEDRDPFESVSLEEKRRG